MKSRALLATLLVACACLTLGTAVAQQNSGAPAAVAAISAVPSLISYAGVLKNSSGRTLTGLTGVTFLLYSEEQGGAPLWLETQNVLPDKTGRFTVQMGAASAQGLPADLFVTEQARWLALQIANEPEQARVLLVAVPYAMKSIDAQTLGGLPPSAFVLAAPPATTTVANAANGSTAAELAAPPPVTSNVTTTGGAANTIPLFTTATNIQNSILTQTGATAINVKGTLDLPATGAATSASGKNSQAEEFVASSFNGTSHVPVNQTYVWKAEAIGNNTATPSATLNLLFGSGAAVPAETGLKINKGIITFAAGQTFPGTGHGTITGVTAGTDLTGGGTSGTVTVSLNTTKVPQLAANNTFTGTQTINNAVTINSANTTSPGLNISTGQTGGDGLDAFSYNTYGVNASSHSSDAVYGSAYGGSGVHGVSSLGDGAYGQSGGGYGVYAISGGAYSVYADGSTSGFGLFSSGSSSAGDFSGNVNVTGTLSKGGGSFKIDHPLDPANKYLYHSFVESPDMMNIYNGNAILGRDGAAWITLPDYFEALNRDFRYQLTAVGAPGPNLHIAHEIAHNRFQIAGGTAGAKVSWQVTGIRQDAFAQAHRIIPEVAKTGYEKGKYLYPVENGQPKSMGIDQSRRKPGLRREQNQSQPN